MSLERANFEFIYLFHSPPTTKVIHRYVREERKNTVGEEKNPRDEPNDKNEEESEDGGHIGATPSDSVREIFEAFV